MTPNQIKEARNHVTKLINAHPSHPDIERITNMGAHHLTAALDEIERLREAIKAIDAAAFNDNGDITYSPSAMRNAFFKARAALKGGTYAE